MRSDLGLFWWAVQPGAYRWRTATVVGPGEDRAETSLWVMGGGSGPGGRPRPYQPLREQTGLFQIFAGTPPTREGVLHFADRFGMLLDASLTVTPPDPIRGRRAKLKETLAQHREGYEFWRAEVLKMREAVRIWEMLEGDADGLARHVRLRQAEGGQTQAEYDSHPDLPAGAVPPHPDGRITEAAADAAEQVSRPKRSDLVQPARALLRRMINRQLEGRLRPAVELGPDGDLHLALAPSNLLAAMWLQLALAACEHKRYRRCVVCGNPFGLSPETARTNRRFCSISCKNRAFRSRQEQARRLHAEGKAAREIAKELGATVDSVKGWIDPKGR